MQFGVCGGPELARLARDAGYDYFEWSVGALLCPREDERVFATALAQARAVGLPFPTANVFIPADLKITGPAIDEPALHAYAATALRRAQAASLELIVFGSGAARRVPDGFDRARAWQQLIRFGRWLAGEAAARGLTIAVEPLNTGETNILNTAEEGAALVREVNHPAFRLLVDGYHWAVDHNSPAGITANAGLIAHAHVAAAEGRVAPHPGDPCAPFFAALRQAGYQGRVSFEGNLHDPAVELQRALAIMRQQAAG